MEYVLPYKRKSGTVKYKVPSLALSDGSLTRTQTATRRGYVYAADQEPPVQTLRMSKTKRMELAVVRTLARSSSLAD